MNFYILKDHNGFYDKAIGITLLRSIFKEVTYSGQLESVDRKYRCTCYRYRGVLLETKRRLFVL